MPAVTLFEWNVGPNTHLDCTLFCVACASKAPLVLCMSPTSLSCKLQPLSVIAIMWLVITKILLLHSCLIGPRCYVENFLAPRL